MPENNILQGGQILSYQLPIEKVDALSRKIKLDVEEPDNLDEYFDDRTWPMAKMADGKEVPARSVPFRVVIDQHPVTMANLSSFWLYEDKAPDYGKLQYASFSIVFPESFAYKYIYTWKDVMMNPDDTLVDIHDQMTIWAKDLKKLVKAKCLITGTTNVLSWATVVGSEADYPVMKMVENFERIAKNMKDKYWDGTSYRLLCASYISDKLTDEILKKYGASYVQQLPTPTVAKTLTGYLSHWKHTDLVDPDCDDAFIERYTEEEAKADSTGKTVAGAIKNFVCVFLAKTPQNKKSCIKWTLPKGTDVFDNGLGHAGPVAVASDPSKITGDDNHQKGSVAMNIYGYTCNVFDDRGIIICKIPASAISGIATENADALTKALPIHDFATLLAKRQETTSVEYLPDDTAGVYKQTLVIHHQADNVSPK